MSAGMRLTPRRARKPRIREDLVAADELHLRNRSTIEPGTPLSIDGLRGRWTFVRYTRNTGTGQAWVDVMQDGRSRTVRPERITTVHRSPREP